MECYWEVCQQRDQDRQGGPWSDPRCSVGEGPGGGSRTAGLPSGTGTAW